MKKIILLIFMIFSLSAGDYEKGMDAMNHLHYQDAIAIWTPLAEDGNAKAQNGLAVIYTHGLGVTQDFKKAFFWYQKSAHQGYASAEYGLGAMYSLGLGMKIDYTKARYWLERAAKQNSADAYYDLAALYCEGLGVTKDLHQCALLAKKAASGGYDVSKFWDFFELDKFQ